MNNLISKLEQGETRIVISKSWTESILKFENWDSSSIVTPFNFVKEQLNYVKSNILYKHILQENSSFESTFSQFEPLTKISEKLNEEIDFELIEKEYNFDKIFKAIFKVRDLRFTNHNLFKVLYFIDKNITSKKIIFIGGFTDYSLIINHRFEKVTPVIYVDNTSVLRNANFNLEQIIFLRDEDIIEVLDEQRFISWLESATNLVIDKEMLLSILNGIDNSSEGQTIKSFLIK